MLSFTFICDSVWFVWVETNPYRDPIRRKWLGSHKLYCWSSLFKIYFYHVLFLCVYLRPVSCVANVFSVSGLSILSWPSNVYFLILAWSMVKLAWSKLFFHFHAQDYILPVYIIHGVAKTYPPIQDRGNVLSNTCASSIFVLLHVVRLSIHVTCSTQYKAKNIFIEKVFDHAFICSTDDETNQYFLFAILNILRFESIKLA